MMAARFLNSNERFRVTKLQINMAEIERVAQGGSMATANAAVVATLVGSLFRGRLRRIPILSQISSKLTIAHGCPKATSFIHLSCQCRAPIMMFIEGVQVPKSGSAFE